MSPKDHLTKAKALIAKPINWTKYSSVKSRGKGKVCMCARGAVFAVHRGDRTTGAAIALLEDALPPRWRRVQSFNDASATTHADVMALYDRAIEAAKP